MDLQTLQTNEWTYWESWKKSLHSLTHAADISNVYKLIFNQQLDEKKYLFININVL